MPPRPRNTTQRQAITAQLAALDTFVSAQQLHEILASSGQSIGLATVYRNLQLLADDGSVDVVRTESELLYRYCDTSEHHHHLVCRSCGKTVEFAGKQLEDWIRRITKETQFVDIDHTIELMGTCAQCAEHQKEPAKEGASSIPHENDPSDSPSSTHGKSKISDPHASGVDTNKVPSSSATPTPTDLDTSDSVLSGEPPRTSHGQRR